MTSDFFCIAEHVVIRDGLMYIHGAGVERFLAYPPAQGQPAEVIIEATPGVPGGTRTVPAIGAKIDLAIALKLRLTRSELGKPHQAAMLVIHEDGETVAAHAFEFTPNTRERTEIEYMLPLSLGLNFVPTKIGRHRLTLKINGKVQATTTMEIVDFRTQHTGDHTSTPTP